MLSCKCACSSLFTICLSTAQFEAPSISLWWCMKHLNNSAEHQKKHILCYVCLAPEAFQAPHSPWARGWEMEDWSTTRYEFRARNLPKEAFALCFCIKYACVSEVQAIVHVFLPTSSITGEGRVLREIFRNVSVIYVKLIKNTTALW